MEKEKHYRIIWEIDIYSSDSPLDAVHRAIRAMPRKNKTAEATVFTVIEKGSEEQKDISLQIDLMEENNEVAIQKLDESKSEFGLFNPEKGKRIHGDKQFSSWSNAYRFAVNCGYEVKSDIPTSAA